MTDEVTHSPPTEGTLPELLTVAEAARFLRCSPLTVTRKLRASELPGIKYGRSWMLPRNALIRAINDEAFSAALGQLEQMQKACGDLLRRADHIAILQRKSAAASPAPAMAPPEPEPQRRKHGRPRTARTAPSFPYTFNRTE